MAASRTLRPNRRQDKLETPAGRREPEKTETAALKEVEAILQQRHRPHRLAPPAKMLLLPLRGGEEVSEALLEILIKSYLKVDLLSLGCIIVINYEKGHI
jgi:hypothetical protein